MAEEQERCCFDDSVDRWSKKARRRGTVSGITSPLLEAVAEAGLAGRTVLDVGCGIGDLALATLDEGATRANGFDLSPRAIEAARRFASERGLSDRATFEVGDGAKVQLPAADVVLLNRVVCCYPDAEALLGRTLSAAGHVYALTVPVSTGLVGWWLRLWARIGNAWYRRRATYAGYQTFVHDVDGIDGRVRSAGFVPVQRERWRMIWELAVYARP